MSAKQHEINRMIRQARYTHDSERGITVAVYVKGNVAYMSAAFADETMGDKFSRVTGRTVSIGRIHRVLSNPEYATKKHDKSGNVINRNEDRVPYPICISRVLREGEDAFSISRQLTKDMRNSLTYNTSGTSSDEESRLAQWAVIKESFLNMSIG